VEEDISLLAMDRYVRGTALSDRVRRSGDILIVLVFSIWLSRVGFDSLKKLLDRAGIDLWK